MKKEKIFELTYWRCLSSFTELYETLHDAKSGYWYSGQNGECWTEKITNLKTGKVYKGDELWEECYKLFPDA